MPKAEMDAGAKGDVPVRPPREIEMFGPLVRGGIEVGCDQHGHDLVTALETYTANLRILAREARLREIHWRDETQELLDREIGAVPVLFEPVPQCRIFHELKDRAADEVGGGLVAG